LNYGLSTYTSLSHLLESNLDYSLTKRLKIAVRNSFLASRDPFDRLRASELPQGAQVQDQRSDSFIAPSTRTTSGQAAVELSYASGPHGTVGASGSFFRVKYNALAGFEQQPAPALEDARSIGGRAFYSYHLTRTQWTGFEYNLQNLSSRAARSQYLVQSLLYVHKLALSSAHTLSIVAGPERSAMQHSSVAFLDSSTSIHSARSNWGWAGVASYNWTGAPTSVLAVLSHRISDGGLLGPVRLSGGTAELRQKLATRWTADFLAAYNRSRTVALVPSTLSYSSAGAGIIHALNEGLSVEFRYWRIHQSTSSARAAAYLADHNRVSLSLTYDLKNPLGR
jgi:hypothetical protein